MKKTTALRRSLKKQEFLYMPVAYDALGGRLLQSLGFGQVVEDVAAQVVEAFVHEAEAAGGEQRVAAALLERRLLQHQHLGRALLLRGDRGAQRRVSGANHDHVEHIVHP